MSILNTQICPRCRSKFLLVSLPSIDSPAIQTVKCPVCGQAIKVSTPLFGFVKISAGAVLEKYDVPANVPQVILGQVSQEEKESIWKDFSIMEPLKGIGLGVSTVGLVAALIVIAVLLWRK